MKMQIAIVGWRGMVGSVLTERIAKNLTDEHLLDKVDVHFFSTSQSGMVVNKIGNWSNIQLKDALNVDVLAQMDVIVTSQGSEYTKKMHPKLRSKGWNGYWLDAASDLRMQDTSTIVLDPVNRKHIDERLNTGCKDFIGGNCTVSLLLMALCGLIKDNLVEWVSAMTYQAISGAGAEALQELVAQNRTIVYDLNNNQVPALALEQRIRDTTQSTHYPKKVIGASLATTNLPWIDSDLGNGQSREEWKATAESNKLLGMQDGELKIEGICTRVASLRCHAQALFFKVKKPLSEQDMVAKLQSGHQWLRFVKNSREATLSQLTADTISGTLEVAIGRLRSSQLQPNCWNAYTIGDQLLWGAAEPIARMLPIIINHKS